MVQKIGRGFEYEGFNLKVVSSVKQITDPGFVMISDHPFYYSFGSRNNSKGGIQRIVPSIIQKTKILDWIANFFCKVELSRLVKHIAGKNIVVIAFEFWVVHFMVIGVPQRIAVFPLVPDPFPSLALIWFRPRKPISYKE